MPHQATNNVCILTGTLLNTQVENTNVDLAEGQKCQALTGIKPADPLIQSQGFNPIYMYHGTSTFMEQQINDELANAKDTEECIFYSLQKMKKLL